MVGASAAVSTGEPVTFPTQPIPSSKDATPRAAAADVDEKKSKKRGLFGFGKKKTEDVNKPSSKTDASSLTTQMTSPTRRTAASPIRTEHTHYTPSSPNRPFASSPRLSSPAGSQIFERNVQESTAVALPTSPAIPSHIQTENYIPPVLDASSEAITDTHLNPDSVEIITHTSHQPAAVTVTGGGGGIGVYSEPTWVDELAAFSLDRGNNPANPDSASNYGSLDTTDVRRLSFISFADVVQAEQHSFGGVAGSRESMHVPGLTSLSSLNNNTNRSPSPIRSPVSSSGGSKTGSMKGVELSPARNPLGSPTSLMGHSIPPLGLNPAVGPTVSGELSIETMSQALRRTGSGDLRGGVIGGGLGASLPQSPI
ncbi:hypothetical protein QBC40DRAFT_307121 [Triangularia verruculosa]|uniref:Uncharacterized protein n=1 Tax=Triangularia verruculosa TaxID=2587418 RepID=A0AAN7ASV3_9PEZI|nr:hypothetical protein QBC40DRAFT_307121 [Triangularia verruculosa]